jgi:hypothetical protein
MSITTQVLLFFLTLLVMWSASTFYEWLIFQRVFDDPVKGKLSSVAAAWLTAALSSKWIGGNGALFDPEAMKIITIPTVIIALSGLYRGLKLRKRAEVLPEVFE